MTFLALKLAVGIMTVCMALVAATVVARRADNHLCSPDNLRRRYPNLGLSQRAFANLCYGGRWEWPAPERRA
jgi:hypothetical protein